MNYPKQLLSCLLAIMGTLALASEHYGMLGFLPHEKTFYGDKRPHRNIQIGTEIRQTWKQNDYLPHILISPNAPKAIQFAARELKKYLDKRFDTQIPITDHQRNGQPFISLGINEFSKKAGIDTQSLTCRDSFIIRTIGKNIYILGQDDPHEDTEFNLYYYGVWSLTHEHGTLFGVYDFLERFAGLRIYFPHELGTVMPMPETPMTLPDINIFDRPDFEDRRTQVYNCTWDDDKPKEDLYQQSRSPDKNYYACFLRWSTKLVPTTHGLRDLQLNRRFGAKHPEFFAMTYDGKRLNNPNAKGNQDSQLCYSSQVIDVIRADAIAMMRKESPSKRGIFHAYDSWGAFHLPGRIFSAMPQDGYQICRCPLCRPHMDSDQHISDFMWSFTAKLARDLKAVNPQAIVTQMAYWPYLAVPNVDLPDNIEVQLGVQGALNMNTPEALKQELALIRAWKKKLGHPVWLWNYCNKGGASKIDTLPGFLPRKLGAYYKLLRHDIYGAFLQSDCDTLLNAYLNHYVMMKTCWNLDTDVEQLLAEHHRLMFGPGAKYMSQFYDKLESLWTDGICGKKVNSALGPVTAPPPLNEVWGNIYSEQILKQLGQLCTEAENSAIRQRDFLAARRIRFIRQRLFDPMLNAREKYMRATSASNDFYLNMQQEATMRPVINPVKQPMKTMVKAYLDTKGFSAHVICYETKMHKMPHFKRPNGDRYIWQDEEVEVFLNANGRRDSYLQILANVSGAHTVLASQDGQRLNLTTGFDCQITTQCHSDRWEAIIQIPLKHLGTIHPEGPLVNFNRTRHLDGGDDYYSVSPFVTKQRGFADVDCFVRLRTKTIAQSNHKNLVKDGDFSSERHTLWKPDWLNGFSAVRDDHDFFRSPGSLRLTATQLGSLPMIVGSRQVLHGLRPGGRYRLTYFVKTQHVESAHPMGGARIQVWTGSNAFIPQPGVQNSTGWIKQVAEFTISPKASEHTCTIRPEFFNATGTAWFDDITLTELP